MKALSALVMPGSPVETEAGVPGVGAADPPGSAWGYDLVLPGNWEVVYGKQRMISDLDAYTAHKTCANMFHARQDSTTEAPDGTDAPPEAELLFPPYWTTMVAGIKLGFIGYNDPFTPTRQSPARCTLDVGK